MRDMHIQWFINKQYTSIADIKAGLSETPPPTDYGLIRLQHLTTAAQIIGAVCSVSLISLIVEIIYKYVKERFSNEN